MLSMPQPRYSELFAAGLVNKGKNCPWNKNNAYNTLFNAYFQTLFY